PPLTLSTVFRPSSREFAPRQARFFWKKDRLVRLALRASGARVRQERSALGPRLLRPRCPTARHFDLGRLVCRPPTTRGLRVRRPRARKEPPSPFGRVTPG